MDVWAQGIPRVTDYERLIRSSAFAAMKRFSDQFLDTYRHHLRAFRRVWVADPLSQWSRAWEYPFAFAHLERFARGREQLEILDAGSGVTFFPFFIAQELKAHVRCVDRDRRLARPFRAIVAQLGARVTYQLGDIRELRIADAALDAIVCVSVLEHTDRYREIATEFLRVLRPGGLLVLTFDISPSGAADLPPDKAGDLLETVMAATDPFADSSSEVETLEQALDDMKNRLTTNWARKHLPQALPWMFPTLSALKASIPRGHVKTFLDLTCYCCARTRPEHPR